MRNRNETRMRRTEKPSPPSTLSQYWRVGDLASSYPLPVLGEGGPLGPGEGVLFIRPVAEFGQGGADSGAELDWESVIGERALDHRQLRGQHGRVRLGGAHV